jgi:hypothetical protein
VIASKKPTEPSAAAAPVAFVLLSGRKTGLLLFGLLTVVAFPTAGRTGRKSPAPGRKRMRPVSSSGICWPVGIAPASSASQPQARENAEPSIDF